VDTSTSLKGKSLPFSGRAREKTKDSRGGEEIMLIQRGARLDRHNYLGKEGKALLGKRTLSGLF